MLVCHVSMRPPRRAISADIVEAGAALDASTIGQLILATLVDDPASVGDIVDAYLGEIMLEPASAADSFDAGLLYAADVNEIVTASDTQSGSIAIATSTWNPSDKSANITLSAGNLTAAQSSATAGGVRSTGNKSSSKLYFEVTWTNPQTGGTAFVGIATGAASLAGVANNAANAAAITQGGRVWYNTTTPGSINLGNILNGQTTCVALDLGNSRIWFRTNAGLWNNNASADPATNVGGTDISSLFPTNAAYAVYAPASSTISVTANFGAAAFTYTVPSGFSAWG